MNNSKPTSADPNVDSSISAASQQDNVHADDGPESPVGVDAFSKIADVAQQAGSRASEAASSVASEAGTSAREIIDQQVRVGADLVSHIAASVRAAADALKQDAPGLSGLARAGAEKADRISETLRNRSAGDLMGAASEFTRHNPAVVFGGAALAGFVLYRTLTSASPELHASYDDNHTAGPRGGTLSTKRLDQNQRDLIAQNQPS